MKVSPKTSLIKKLSRNLRYQSLTEFVGKELIIKSIHTVEDDIHSALGKIPLECKLHTKVWEIVQMVGRQGFLDLTFSVPLYLLESQYQSGIALLKELGFVLNPSEAKEIEEDDDLWMRFLTSLTDDIAKNTAFLRMFLLTESPQLGEDGWPVDSPSNSSSTRVAIKYRSLLLKQYVIKERLPRQYKIRDACFTNVTDVWANKYFYL